MPELSASSRTVASAAAATNLPLRVLCLDIEGGHGGSSRSLFEILRHLNRDQISPEVWCRRAGPMEARYAELGIPSRVEPAMPKVSSLPRLSRNLAVYGAFAFDWRRTGDFRRRLATAARSVDVIHFNHEALFLLARWLRRASHAAFVCHIRTNLWDTPFARWQNRLLAKTMDRFVFITENERATFERLAEQGVQGSVIYNAVSPPETEVPPHEAVPQDKSIRLASLSNYSWLRGPDRLVDLAAALAACGRSDMRLVVAGDMSLSGSLPGALGRIARRGGTLADYAAERGVADMFHFLGHVPDPERVLAACDMLVKPTREDNPWGRDILEAMAAGKPVISIGSYDRFVEDGVTGILLPEFDASALARRIIELVDDPAARHRMGAAARERVVTLCDGVARAADLAALWRDAADAR